MSRRAYPGRGESYKVYRLDPVDEAEARLAMRACKVKMPKPPLLSAPCMLAVQLRKGYLGGGCYHNEPDVLVCPNHGMVLFEETTLAFH